MQDILEFKLELAQKHLAKIPNKIPSTHQKVLEENAESFLFFSSSVIEIVKRQINDKFEVFDRKNVFYIYALKKNLAGHGAQKQAKSTISDYFTTPKQTKSGVNAKKSSLWRLQSLRNQAMHGSIIQKHGKHLVFSYTIHDVNSEFQFLQKTQNPHKYFDRLLTDLQEFTAKISAIIESA